MKEEFRKLWLEFQKEVYDADLYDHLTIEGFWFWLLTGEV